MRRFIKTIGACMITDWKKIKNGPRLP
jgi:hypothetical protein